MNPETWQALALAVAIPVMLPGAVVRFAPGRAAAAMRRA